MRTMHRIVACTHLAGCCIKAHKRLWTRTLRRATGHRQRLKSSIGFTFDYPLVLLDDGRQVPVGLACPEIMCWHKAQRAHGTITHESQTIQRPWMAQPFAAKQAIHQHRCILDVTPLEISASRVRALLAAGRDPRYLLPESVFADPTLLAAYRDHA